MVETRGVDEGCEDQCIALYLFTAACVGMDLTLLISSGPLPTPTRPKRAQIACFNSLELCWRLPESGRPVEQIWVPEKTGLPPFSGLGRCQYAGMAFPGTTSCGAGKDPPPSRKPLRIFDFWRSAGGTPLPKFHIGRCVVKITERLSEVRLVRGK